MVKDILRDIVIDTPIWRLRQQQHYKRRFQQWEAAGCTGSPPHPIKQQILAAYAKSFATKTLIETGTYVGDMVHAMKDRFARIVSIELSPVLAARAKRRFKRYSHIQILHGDSGELLSTVLKEIGQTSLFWLDGHYSAGDTAKGIVETPILNEIKVILRHKIQNHVILIDDARCFDGTHDYPTIPEVELLVRSLAPTHQVSLKHDVIRIHAPAVIKTDY